MFASVDLNALMREKEDHAARSQPLRGFFHQRIPPQRPPFSHSYTTSSIPRNMWDHQYPNSHDSYHNGAFHGDFLPSWRSMSPSGRGAPTTTPRSEIYQERRISFEQAVVDMITALEYSSTGLQKVADTFNNEISPLKLWLPPQHIDSLWMIYTAWDGVPTVPRHPSAGLNTHANKTKTKPANTYAGITKRISKALAGLKDCSPPNVHANGGNGENGAHSYFTESRGTTAYNPNSGLGLGWDILRTTMRKLEISLEAIAEMLASMRISQDRLPALKHEMNAALQLLEGIRPSPAKVAPQDKGKAAAREPLSTRGNEHEEHNWEDYGAI